jgi:hypothetical protein
MAKVTVTDTPAAAAAPAKPKFETVQDSRGRSIRLRTLDPIQQGRLVMAVGGEVSQNSTYMSGFAMPAAMVAHIDDAFFGLPRSIKEIEAMLAELGIEGMNAINEHLMAKFQAMEEEQRKAALSAEQAAAKN